jgi:hypothetical protein
MADGFHGGIAMTHFTLRSFHLTALLATLATAALAGPIQKFTIQNATNPAAAGGVFNNGIHYWGDLTVDQDLYQAFRDANSPFATFPFFDVHLFVESSPGDDATDFQHPIPLVLPQVEFTGNLFGNPLSIEQIVAPTAGGNAGIDKVTISLLSDFVTFTAPQGTYRARGQLNLTFFEPTRGDIVVQPHTLASFKGGVVVAADYFYALQNSSGDDLLTLGRETGADNAFSAIAIDPQIVPVESPAPGTLPTAGLALGFCAWLARRGRNHR